MTSALAHHFQTRQQPIDVRIGAGKALRKKVKRSSMGEYKPHGKRIDPVSVLERQAKTRVAELVPIRYARMLVSPFAFLRGSAAIMAADMAATSNDSGLIVQACGDMHVANFGVFASAERNLIFGINDFDETIPGPWEWDLKRLVVSIVASAEFLGGNKAISEEAIRSAVTSYRKKMKQYAGFGHMDLWYSTIDEKDIMGSLSPSAKVAAEKILGKARERTHMQVLGKLTDMVDDKYRLRVNAPFIVRQSHTDDGTTIEEATDKVLQAYFRSLAHDRASLLKHYSIRDVVRKVVGVGSVGTRCWVIFMNGNHEEDPLFLQFKEAEPSALSPYVKKSYYQNEGQRVVSGQRLIQGAPDIFLGYGEINKRHFYVRQLRDMKGV